MAEWYVSSAAYALIPQWQATHAYVVGNIIRPLTAPAFAYALVYRCTVPGTTGGTEPNWPSVAPGTNHTANDGTVTWQNVAAQSTYGWAAASPNLLSISVQGNSPKTTFGDRIFMSSDHTEASSTATYSLASGNTFNTIQVISVNRAGSVPPVAADALSGANITYNGAAQWYLEPNGNLYWQGITFNLGGSGVIIYFSGGTPKGHYFKNCAFVLSTSSTTAYIGTQTSAQVTFDNTTVQFNAAGQRLFFSGGSYPVDFKWLGGATLGTSPTVLFAGASNSAPATHVVCRGVDFSTVTTTLFYGAGASNFGKLLLDSCRIASGVVRLGTTAYNTTQDEVELVNCHDGSNFLDERHTPAGDLTRETTITLTGGAQDTIGAFAHKMVTSVRSDRYAMTLDGFWMDVGNLTISGPRTATVEIISSGTLNTDDISLFIEYQGTAGSSRASFASSFPIVVMATPVALTTSTATWNSSPATPVKQKLQVTFTPQVLGRVRGQVRLGKASTTVYVDQRMTLT